MIRKLISKLLLSLFNLPGYRKINLYIVDDIVYYAMLVKVNLEKEGYDNIKVFYDGESLMEDLKNTKVDCIILDYKLSDEGLNGDDILNKLIITNPDIKIIILSGQESLDVAANTMKLGAYDYIVKNDLAFFNLTNKLSVLEDSINAQEKNNWLDKRIKFLYMVLILLLWAVSLMFFI